MSLPEWWPRVSCIYCGKRIEGYDRGRQKRGSRISRHACDLHRVIHSVDRSVDDSEPAALYDRQMQDDEAWDRENRRALGT